MYTYQDHVLKNKYYYKIKKLITLTFLMFFINYTRTSVSLLYPTESANAPFYSDARTYI